jgi:phosphohistidine phosphatase
MEIYILRHGIAVSRGTPGYPNDDRPLTEDGIEKMTEAALGIAKIVDKFDVVVSSPLIRALDTAGIAAEAIKYKDEIVSTKFLMPGSLPSSLFDFLGKYKSKRSVLLVGHEPHLGILASRLLGYDDSVIEFKKGGICRIDIDSMPPHSPGTLIWSLAPKQLRLIAKTKNIA